MFTVSYYKVEHNEWVPIYSTPDYRKAYTAAERISRARKATTRVTSDRPYRVRGYCNLHYKREASR